MSFSLQSNPKHNVTCGEKKNDVCMSTAGHCQKTINSLKTLFILLTKGPQCQKCLQLKKHTQMPWTLKMEPARKPTKKTKRPK